MDAPNQKPRLPAAKVVTHQLPHGGGYTTYLVRPDGTVDFDSLRLGGMDNPPPPDAPGGVTFTLTGCLTKGLAPPPADDH